VEKSELWVSKKGDSKKDKVKNEEDEPVPSAPAQSALEVCSALPFILVAVVVVVFL